MKERPILMSGAMVRATLREVAPKTQTRRAIAQQPADGWLFDVPPQFGRITSAHPKKGRFGAFIRRGVGTDFPQFDLAPCPYGMPGDHLWVRESLAPTRNSQGYIEDWHYAADGAKVPRMPDLDPMFSDAMAFSHLARMSVPSIHMPRWASRITLEVTGVRVERLQDISEEDALAEGIRQQICGWFSVPGIEAGTTARAAFALLWNSLNAARGYGWDTNPWVWVIQFRRIKQ